MGQKVNPIGFRVGIIRDWESKWYADDKNFAPLLLEDYKIRKQIKTDLKHTGISSIEIERPAKNKIKVTINAAKPGFIIGRGGKGIEEVKAKIEKISAKTGVAKDKLIVNVNVVEIKSPDTNAQLVAESIAGQIEKRISFKRAMKQAITRAMKFNAKGIKIRAAGRLGGSEMARVEKENAGKVPLHTIRADIDYGFSEAATQYGHIGVKVWIYKGDILPGHRRKVEQADYRPKRAKGGDRPKRRRTFDNSSKPRSNYNNGYNNNNNSGYNNNNNNNNNRGNKA